MNFDTDAVGATSAVAILGASGPRTIISVYPLPLELKLNHEGQKLYKIDAAPKGGFSSLTVKDTFAVTMNFSLNQRQLSPVPATIVADNLVNMWTRGRVGSDSGLGPGVLIIAGTEPTDAELETARTNQEAYFRFLVNDADIKYATEGGKNITTGDHRMAADWLGVQDRPWSKEIKASAPNKNCPACAESIKPEAIICKHCGTNTQKFLEDRTEIVMKAEVKPKPQPKAEPKAEPKA